MNFLLTAVILWTLKISTLPQLYIQVESAIWKISDRDFLLEYSFSMETPDVFRGFSRLDMSFRSGFMSI